MQDMVSLKNQIDGLELLLKNKKKVLAKYFDVSDKRSLSNEECTVYVQEKTSISYDILALERELPKEILSKILNKTYIIDNPEGMSNYLLNKGVNFKELKAYIKVDKSVNEKGMEALYDSGELSIEDLEGCYDAKVNKSIVLKMKNIDKEQVVSSKNG